MKNLLDYKKKGQTSNIGILIGGVIGLIFLVVVGFVSVQILIDSNLLTANSAFDNATDRMVNNLSDGVDQVSLRLVTIFTIAVAVLLLALIGFLVVRARQAQAAQGGSI